MCIVVVQSPGGGGGGESCLLPVVLDTSDKLDGCIAMPSAAGQDGQRTKRQPGEVWLQDLVES